MEEKVTVQTTQYFTFGDEYGRRELDVKLAAGWRYVASIPNPSEPGWVLLILEREMTPAEHKEFETHKDHAFDRERDKQQGH